MADSTINWKTATVRTVTDIGRTYLELRVELTGVVPAEFGASFRQASKPLGGSPWSTQELSGNTIIVRYIDADVPPESLRDAVERAYAEAVQHADATKVNQVRDAEEAKARKAELERAADELTRKLRGL